ncbi:hypothetical protein CEE45_12975 [Candidatus Heimdallarchaeota archaeon B3_Heim]|nr:MAG: hypothetical protein CEE45_12975 [Candidatus Heimdallarchaeota archaeon B3_Heim]
MPFDSFFRELEKANNSGKERILCYCRHPNVGQLKIQPDDSYFFEGECTPNKACFKIKFDCSRIPSRNLQVLTKISSKKRKEWETRPTLDKFFEKDYFSRVSKQDAPSPSSQNNEDIKSDP